jgi:indolepyruvate ferredoxin oxidoreductase, beta subunit
MKYDILLAGVGGQGVLSLAATIARAAMESSLFVKQSEVHGMAQRGGAVLAHLRLSDAEIQSDLISSGGADMILSMEPLESLRYLRYLRPGGALVTDRESVKNIGDYPSEQWLFGQIAKIPGAKVVDARALAAQAGSPRSANIALVGAAAHFLPLDKDALAKALRGIFGKKGEAVVEANLRALDLGFGA